MNAPRIAILKPGTFTAVDGSQHSYSEADLAAIAAAYAVESDPAPLVIGHPQMNDPAYGWVERLAVEGGELVAYPDPERLEPAFAEAVRAGRYSKVSASLYPPAHKHSPKPDGWYLQHVGFLGAKAPAVKGLGSVAFAESEGLITIEQEKEVSEKNKPTPEQTADLAEREAGLTQREQALADRETAIAARETELAEQARAARHDGNVAFAEALVESGKLAPAGKELAIVVLDDLASATVQFGEGEGASEITPAAAFRKLLEGAGTIVAFGEQAKPTGNDNEADDPQAIADKAVAFAEEQKAAGKIVSIAQAVRHVTRKAA